MTADAPVMLDHLSPESRTHFDTVLAHLDALGVPIRDQSTHGARTGLLAPRPLRVRARRAGSAVRDRRRRPLRRLMRELGGQDLSGIGFGLGVDRTLLALKAEGVTAGPGSRVEVFGVPLGTRQNGRWRCWARSCARPVFGGSGLRRSRHEGRDEGGPTAPGAALALVAGDRDIEAGTVGVKDLATGEQVDVAADSVVAEVLSRLAGRRIGSRWRRWE